MDLIDVKLDNIFIDPENPRFDQKTKEAERISELIRETKILKLCEDIAQYGLDPSENMLATYDKVKEQYRVREGNRRIAALKILNNPEYIPDIVKNKQQLITELNKVKKI